MKNTLLLLICVLAGFPGSLFAQEPMEPGMPPPPDEFGPPGEGEPPPPMMEPGGESPAPVDQWMERMKDRHPEDFEHLREMREKDPMAFRGVLRQRLTDERVLAKLKEHQEVYEALMRLPEQERKEVLRSLSPSAPFGGPGGGPGKRDPKIREMERETLEMSRAFRAAKDETEKTRIRGDLRAKLEELFDLRERERKSHIDRIEKDLAELQKTLADRQAHRDEIITRRLEQLTEGEKLGW
jgi:hypothetical protein